MSTINIKNILEKLSIASLNPLQEALVKTPNKDTVMLSPTGSGKTLAFLLPTIFNLKPEIKGLQALIIAPTRELAIQINAVIQDIKLPYKSSLFYGGHPFSTERSSLSVMPTVLVATPGRLVDHLNRKTIVDEDLDTIQTFVIDEFDKALELGFHEELAKICNAIPASTRKILSSATRLDELPKFIPLKDKQEVDFLPEVNLPSTLEISKLRSADNDKLETLSQLLTEVGDKPTLVFCNHRDAVNRISDILYDLGIVHETFHGGLEQEERERALIKFRNGSYQVLLTTDLAARGLDIPDIQYVIHYQLPNSEKTYIHRNGRTARMHKDGKAIILLKHDDYLPEFIKGELPDHILQEETSLPELPEWVTLYVGAGKKEKVNKIDIVGFFCQQGGLKKDELGKIDVQDHMIYVAVKRNIVQKFLKNVNGKRLKNKKLKIAISK